MRLIEEWIKRIGLWIEELPKHFYEEIAVVSFEGMMTKERLSYERAMEAEFKPMPVGTTWGEKWEYGWFRTKITLPEEAKGQRIFLRPEVGGEMLLFVNGKVAGARDLQHDGITLTRCANGGEEFLIVMESYAGHGPRLENGGPYPPERVPVPEPPKHQVVVKKSGYGIWNEEAFLLYMDAFALQRLYQSLDPKSLRAAKVLEGLFQFTKVVDFELPKKERQKTFHQAREVLQPLLQCVNGSTAPEFTIFGQSHLDLAWKWPWEETRRKCARTISTQLALMEEYEEYQFLLCEPPIMENLKENYPELYERLRKKVNEGKMIPEGGVYVESDTNMVSGESLIRQCIWGKEWFHQEFGVDTRMVWLPDCFGFSGQLPQIMVGCGMKYFTTQKIARALKGCEEFPYNVFDWQGIDGTKILTHFYKKNNSRFDPYLLSERWREDRVQQENLSTFLFPFGFGDGGGGATREMLEMTRRCKDLEGAPRTRMESPVRFFERLEEGEVPRDTYVGEIYLAWHRGTYTAQARTKRGNRKAEVALREAEIWSSILGFGIESRIERKIESNKATEKIKELWKVQLFQQFHDILPGTSIARVQKEAEEAFSHVIEGTREIIDSTLRMFGEESEDSRMILNSLSFNRSDVISVPKEVRSVTIAGTTIPVPLQEGKEENYVEVVAPSCGHVTLTLHREGKRSKNKEKNELVKQNGTLFLLENDLILVEINQDGQICRIYEKKSQTEFADGVGNEFRMYQDINIDYDAWEMNSFYEEVPLSLTGTTSIEILENGPVIGKLRVTKQLHHSLLQQDIVIRAHSQRIDFHTTIDWKEAHKLLKVAFPVRVMTQEAIEEIQFGYVKRPTHRSRRYDADRFEVCNHKYTVLAEPSRGFAVLNDCKYGVSTNGNSIELTLLRAPLIPDMFADQGLQEFTYAIYPYVGSFHESDVVRQGYELNVPMLTAPYEGVSQSYFSISNPSIILETIKPAQDGSEDLILRLYESHGSHAQSKLSMYLPVECVYETSMLEKEIGREFEIRCNQISLEFRPFEIKTLRMKR